MSNSHETPNFVFFLHGFLFTVYLMNIPFLLYQKVPWTVLAPVHKTMSLFPYSNPHHVTRTNEYGFIYKIQVIVYCNYGEKSFTLFDSTMRTLFLKPKNIFQRNSKGLVGNPITVAIITSFYQIIMIHNMEIEIPIPCPKCGGKMHCISYDSATLQILRKRSWQNMPQIVDYERNVDDFKRLLCLRVRNHNQLTSLSFIVLRHTIL